MPSRQTTLGRPSRKRPPVTDDRPGGALISDDKSVKTYGADAAAVNAVPLTVLPVTVSPE
jgi:hypothetical protein